MNDFGMPSFSHHVGGSSAPDTSSQGFEAGHDHHSHDWMPRFRHVQVDAPMDDFLPPPTGSRESRHRDAPESAPADDYETERRRTGGRRPMVVEDHLDRYGELVDRDRIQRGFRRAPERGRYDDRPNDDRYESRDRYRDDRYRDDRPVRSSRSRRTERYDDNDRPVRKGTRPQKQTGSSKALLMTLAGAGIAAVGVFFGFASIAEVVSHSHAAAGPALVGLFGGICATGIGGGMISNAQRK